MRTTHTYVTMVLSRPTFHEIESKLREADYLHAISMDGDRVEGLIMQGIMLICAEESAEAMGNLDGVALPESSASERIAEGFGIPREMLARHKSPADSELLDSPGPFHEKLAAEMREGKASFVPPEDDESETSP